MKIGILEAGVPPEPLVAEHGTYDTMTRHLLGDGHAYETFCVREGRFPAEPTVCDAFVVTGSRCGVHDGETWIGALMDFLRAARGRTRLIGICFGHQVMAQAFGGRVERARQGWGIGLHRYGIAERATWMDLAAAVNIAASHQDQVVEPPPDCRVLAASAFTPLAVLDYVTHPSLSVQFHPEFTPAFSRALLREKRAPNLSEAQINAAIASYDAANDNARVGRWLDRFLATAVVA